MPRLDAIIFGASGFSGKQVLSEIFQISDNENRKITLGIAGRSLEKLDRVIKELQSETGKIFDQVPKIQADTSNPKSLKEMALKTRLIINCTGPYKFHGEPVIKACIENNCHYIDICAEPQFMERMQLLYNQEALEKGIYVVNACGIDTVPTDMGLYFTQKNFNGTLNSIECYQEVLTEDGFGTGPAINLGTWESLIHVLGDYSQLKTIRKKLFQKTLPELVPKLNLKRWPHRIPLSQNWAGPYPGGEITVLRRTQRYFYEKYQHRPIQIHTYIGSNQFWHFWILCLGFWFLVLLCKFKLTRGLLLKYPKVMSFGFFGKEPRKEDTEKIKLVTTFSGRGWKGRNVDSSFGDVEDGSIVTKVSGFDGYRITGTCAAASAIVLLEGQDLPPEGGVYTTAPFFGKSRLVEVLQKNGLKFEICSRNDL